MRSKCVVMLLMAGLFSFTPLELYAQSFTLQAPQGGNNTFSAERLYARKTGKSRAKKPLIIVGASLLGGFYLAGLIIDRAYAPDVVFEELYIPVIGPFLAVANYDDHVSPDYAHASFDKALFIISGALQTTGAVLLITGLAKSDMPDNAMVRAGRFMTNFSVAGNYRNGIMARYRFQF